MLYHRADFVWSIETYPSHKCVRCGVELASHSCIDAAQAPDNIRECEDTSKWYQLLQHWVVCPSCCLVCAPEKWSC